MALGLHGKRVVFLLADGFISDQFVQLRGCLRAFGATTLVASAAEGETLTSANGMVLEVSNLSFAQAAQEIFAALVIADGLTAEALTNDPAAMALLKMSWEQGLLVVTIGGGALALPAAGIVAHLQVAAPADLAEPLRAAGAKITTASISRSGHLFSAHADANMNILCDAVANYLAGGQAKAA